MARDQQDIRELAYKLWEDRGRPDGSAEQDWLDAERELARAETLHDDDPLAATRPAKTLEDEAAVPDEAPGSGEGDASAGLSDRARGAASLSPDEGAGPKDSAETPDGRRPATRPRARESLDSKSPD